MLGLTAEEMMIERLKSISAEISRSHGLPAYEAVDVAWVAIVKAANLLPGKSEHDRMLALLNRLPETPLRAILQSDAVNVLLYLNPPLEALVTAPFERLDKERTAEELEFVRAYRDNEPKEAFRKLANVLKRVRNRRAHGFKTPDGPRDNEILEATSDILQNLGDIAVYTLAAP
jgi:hypothetical protein